MSILLQLARTSGFMPHGIGAADSSLEMPGLDTLRTPIGFQPGLFAISSDDDSTGGGQTHIGLLRQVQRERGEDEVFRLAPNIRVYPTDHHKDYIARELPKRKELVRILMKKDSNDFTSEDYANLVQAYLDTSPTLRRFRHLIPESVIAQGTFGVLTDLRNSDAELSVGKINKNHPLGRSFSEQYFGEDINPGLDEAAKSGIKKEIDRNVIMLLSMKWLYDGNYEAFTACQKDDVKITVENFAQLSSFVKGILDTHPEFMEAMLFNLESNPYGKTKWVKEAVDKAGFQFSGEFQKAMWLYAQIFSGEFENYVALTDAQRMLVLNGYDTIINLGQLIQGEGAEYQFLGLQGKTTDMIQYWLVLAISKISGAAGLVPGVGGSIVMNNSNAIKIIAAIQAMQVYFRNQKSTEAYFAFLDTLAEVFGYDVSDVHSRPALRLSFMLRGVSDYDALKQAVVDLPAELRSNFIKEMNRTHDEGTQTLLFYAPTFLEELGKQSAFSALSKSDQYKVQALFIAQAYQMAREEIVTRSIKDPKFTIDFNGLTEEIQSLNSEGLSKILQAMIDNPEKEVVELEFDRIKKGYKIKLKS